MQAGCAWPPSLLPVGVGRLDRVGLLLGRLDELVDARRAAELVRLAGDVPDELGVGLGVGDRADLLAGAGGLVVLRHDPLELLRRGGAAVAADVGGGVLPARR